MTASDAEARAVGPPSGRSVLTAEEWGAVRAALGLTPRELEVLQYLFDDESEPSIGQHLRLSEHTVHTHIRNMYRKLGVHTRCTLVLRAVAAAREARSETEASPDAEARSDSEPDVDIEVISPAKATPQQATSRSPNNGHVDGSACRPRTGGHANRRD